MKIKDGEKKFEERLIEVNRVSRTVKGGKRLRFRALVAVGDKISKVGIGIGKSNEVLLAVNKAIVKAKKNLIEVPIKNGTIPHEIKVDYGSARVFLKPASSGTSIIAGGAVRVILELAGVKNILSKIMGSSNKINNAKATIIALESFKTPENEKEIKGMYPRASSGLGIPQQAAGNLTKKACPAKL